MVRSPSLVRLALVLASTHGLRKRNNRATGGKSIAGVPVLNYHQAYGGELSMSGLETQEEEWTVVLKEGTTDEQLSDLCRASKKGCNLVGGPGHGGVPFLELRGTELDLAHVLSKAKGAAKFVEPDTLMNMIPEHDFDVGKAVDIEPRSWWTPWGLKRIGVSKSSGGGAGTSIFILDTGVRVSHQDFGGRAIPAFDVTVDGGKDCNGDIACAADRTGHGTHCAGTAAGKKYGVAKLATIQSFKVLNDQGGGTPAMILAGLDRVARSMERPAVASMSLSSFGRSTTMKEGVDAAVNAGVTVVVASGNNGGSGCSYSPAYVPSAITVGAIKKDSWKFGNSGECTNIYAPGEHVRSAVHTSDSGDTLKDGTSMACPHVAGGAALLLAADPSMKPAAVSARLLENAASDLIPNLRQRDHNKLLYVGDGGAPPSPTVVPPRPGSCYDWCYEEMTYCWSESCGGCPYCPLDSDERLDLGRKASGGTEQ